MPHSLTTLEPGVFRNNPNLINITIGKGLAEKNEGICGAGVELCFNDTGLSRITVKNGVKRLGAYSLSSLGIKEVVLPDSLEVIAEGALMYNQIENLVIPKNVTTIDAFPLLGNPLKQISNKTGRSFDWTYVIEGYSIGESFVTGTYGSITITD